MKENRNEVIIKAPAEKVWEVLTNLEGYADWNPLLYRGQGKVEPGATVKVSARTASKQMDFTCKVEKFDPCRQVGWTFHVFHPFLFRGEHIYTLEPIDEQTVRFIDREIFSGLLLPMQAKDLETNGLDGMIAMGEALRRMFEPAN